MKRLISCVLALLYVMAGFASGTWILHGKEYRVDTLYHAYIGPGTTQTSIKLAGPVNLRVFYTTTDLKNENVDVRAIKHKDTLTGLGTVSNAAESHSTSNRSYFAGINADFFSSSMPCGITVVDGEVYCSDQASGWSLFGIDANKIPYSGGGDFYVKLTAPDYSTAELSAMNLERGTNGLVLYSSRKGANTGTDSNGSEVVLIPDGEGNFLTPGATVRMRVQGNPSHAGSMPIPDDGYILSGSGTKESFVSNLSEGDVVEVRCAIRFNGFTGGKIQQALGGCPMLVSGGKVLDTENALDHLTSAQPRTAVGYNAEKNKLVMLVADGRSSISVGPISKVLADIMIYAGCSEAMNFDGGGSSTFYVKGEGVINQPSDGSERSVTDGLYLSTDAPQNDVTITTIRFMDYAKTLNQGDAYTPVIYGYNQYGVLVDRNVEGVTLSCGSSLGTITNDGTTLNASGSGTHMLTAGYGNLTTSLSVTVIGESGISSVDNSQALMIYPNPVEQGTAVSVDLQEVSDALLSVCRSDGVLVSRIAVNAGEKSVSFDTSEWDRGMYILNVIQDKNVKSLKLIVK